jgi:hypothetical protein
MSALFPLTFANEELRLLTAVVIGFLFGFVLERGGFGNARKLAGQFYLHDMTVFKVMFTAILVAMVGLYTLAGLGLVDMARMWVNPTFMWAQVVGGFLLGVGFIMSGLCPGTAVVSAASGRWDGAVTIVGIFFGILGFAIAVDLFPAVNVLYHAGDMGVSVLPAVFGLPTLPFVLLIVVAATLAFLGVEAVERIFSGRSQALELTPGPLPVAKFALAGVLALTLAVGMAFRPGPQPVTTLRPFAQAPLMPTALAERIMAGDPELMVLDLREAAEARIPGSYTVALDSTPLGPLSAAGPATDVVLVDADGSMAGVPSGWPAEVRFHLLRGGWVGWEKDVLAPAQPADASTREVERVRRHNAIAAFFSGAAVQAASAAPPPAIPTSGGGAKPKRGGC